MLIICEDCGKKYNIDESRIRGNRARFTCKECGYIIIVNKSDTHRPLVSSPPTLGASLDDDLGTIDLLKEMEAPSKPDTSLEEPPQEADKKQVHDAKKPANGKPLFTYFLAGILAAFLCISGAAGYLYFIPFASILKQQDSETLAGLLGNTAAVFGIAWIIIVIVFFAIAYLIAKPLKVLKKDINQISQGNRDITITPKGPKEVRELADALSKMSNRLQ